MSVETKLMTADELLAMPDDGAHRHELVQGELITMSPAGFEHGVIAGRIALHLGSYVSERNLGIVISSDTGFVVARDPDTVRAPDVAFVRRERVAKTRKYFPGAPDLAVEVISPNDSFSEVYEKVLEYLRGGTRMVIVVDPDKQTAVVRTPASASDLTITDTLTGGDVVPGWSLPLRELFE
ncbi:MAG TPA: Uma2 family endonuclease [Thermoanaerobaculia bacterium]|nr:Uma2 family endonuclease [Thermoanaerobaculia bacterium]